MPRGRRDNSPGLYSVARQHRSKELAVADRNRESWSISADVRFAVLLIAALVAACGGGSGGVGCNASSPAPGSAAAPAVVTQADVPLIPRRLFFGNPEKAGPTLSDDGRQLAFRAEVDGVMNVWVGPAD